jgi:hypothetical protein
MRRPDTARPAAPIAQLPDNTLTAAAPSFCPAFCPAFAQLAGNTLTAAAPRRRRRRHPLPTAAAKCGCHGRWAPAWSRCPDAPAAWRARQRRSGRCCSLSGCLQCLCHSPVVCDPTCLCLRSHSSSNMSERRCGALYSMKPCYVQAAGGCGTEGGWLCKRVSWLAGLSDGCGTNITASNIRSTGVQAVFEQAG